VAGSGTCPTPGCEEVPDPAANFCEACGADLAARTGTSALTDPAAARACRGCGTPGAAGEEYCSACGLGYADPTERVEAELDGLAGVSDRGAVHPANQDAMALGRHRTGARAAVVCDGVSTTLTPERAAVAVADTALDTLLRSRVDGPTRTRDAVRAAARAVAGLGRGPHGPSCTMVSALVEAGPGGHGTPEVTIGWIGDSRAYWLAAPDSAEPARVLTHDHSWAGEMVAVGMDPAQAAADRRAHQITRWLGPETARPAVDVVTLRPAGPGLLLLCTDGLWNHHGDPAELAAAALPAAAGSGPLAAAAALTGMALAAGGRDNITIVIIPVPGRSRS
jgi:serine/threonine protein phosphatase PrpC